MLGKSLLNERFTIKIKERIWHLILRGASDLMTLCKERLDPLYLA